MNQKDIDAFYIYLNSQQTARQYLNHCYQLLPDVDAEAKSYENCTAFMYYLEHGKIFYENGKKLDIVLQPMLFFYGMTHLLKACLLTKRPDYPESTSILAHGASTRKRKKKDYTFLSDEVKVQQHGLLPYFSEHLFALKRLPFEKIEMRELLGLIPELSQLFQLAGETKLINIGKLGDTILHFPSDILDNYHLTQHAFLQRIKPYIGEIMTVKTTFSTIQLQLSNPIQLVNGPFFLNQEQEIYFPASRDNFLPIPEIIIHYLLLYNLSMLSRYEAEWWGDLLVAKPEIDFPFISGFLELTAEKIPFMLGKLLYQMLKPT